MLKNTENTAPVVAWEELADCALCPRECHADRIKGPSGWCRSDASFRISSICIHRGEEPAVSGPEGICNIFFTNCNLQCRYCQNWQISDNRRDHSADVRDPESAAEEITRLLDRGIRRVGFVSPSHFLPQVADLIFRVRKKGYDPVWVYNSNGYDKAETLRRLEGVVDVYLPDLKYLDGSLAEKFSEAPDYPEKATAALREMYRQKGAALHLADDGTVRSGVIIRHLVLPGEVENSLAVLRFIAEELSPKMHISLMSQYYPTPAVSCHPTLNRTVTPAEYRRVTEELDRLGLHRGWVQEMESHGYYRPDFNNPHPFE